MPYTTAKAALTAFGKALAEEFGPAGVRVNTVSPGAVRTDMWESPEGYGAAPARSMGVEHEQLLDQLPAAMGMVTGGRRLSRRPLLAMALLLGAAVLATTPLSVGEIPLAQFLAVDVALFFVASTRPRRTGLVAAAMALGTLVGYLGVRMLHGWNVGMSAETAVAMTVVIAWLIGNSTHQVREYAEQSRVQAAARAVTARLPVPVPVAAGARA